MKIKRLLSAFIALAMILTMVSMSISAESIYIAENGWTLNGGVEQADGSISIPAGSSNAVIYKPNLEAGKKYSILYDVTGLGTGDTWTYQFFADLSAGSESVAGALSYRMAADGRWNKGPSDDVLVTTGTNGTNEIIIDMETGEWSTYALGVLSQRGVFADPSDFTIKFFHWGGTDPYINNITITELEKNLIYTATDGWIVNGGVEQEDGSLSIPSGSSNAVIFKPNLEANKKYSITYDVTGLSTVSGSWEYQFILGMSAGSTEMSTALMYRMGGDWRTDGGDTVVTSGSNGTNEVIIDTETGEWSLQVLGVQAQRGIFADISEFALKFYHWGTVEDPYISNVQITELEKLPGGATKVPTGSSNAVVYKPNLEANKKYSITYDVTGLSTVGGSWEYQFILGMSAGSTEMSTALMYRMGGDWRVDGGDTVVTSGSNGTNEVIIDTETGEWSLYALGTLAKTGIFTDISNFTLKFYHWGSMEDPYISNIDCKELIYRTADGWTLNGGIEQVDGSISIPSGSSAAVIYKPNLEEGKKYSITYDVTGLGTGDSWTYQFFADLSAGSESVAGALSYRMAADGRWNKGPSDDILVTTGTNGTNEIVIDMETGEWSTYALGKLSNTGTFEDTTDFTIKFFRWGGEAPYISNVEVKELKYRTADGWTLNGGIEQVDGSISIPSGSSAAVIYKPNLEEGKKYSIKYDVTGLETGDDGFAFQFFANMSAGGVDIGNVLAYRMAGKWVKSSSDDTLVATGTNGTNEIIIDMETGEWSTYALGTLAQTGTLTDTEDFTLKFYHWGSMSDPYINNVVVTEIKRNVIYTAENGWTVNGGVEQEDGSISIPSGSSNAVIYKPNLEAGKKYSITYDVTGLGTGDSWTYQFLADLAAGGTDAGVVLSYRMAANGRWNVQSSDTLVSEGTNGKNEIIIDMETGEWSTYALGNLSQSGTFADTTDFSIKFYRWGGTDSYISNVQVAEVEDVQEPSYRLGDANGDTEVDVKDVIVVRRFITGGYSVTINEDAANVNGDTDVDVKDVITLRRFITGGYGVELK